MTPCPIIRLSGESGAGGGHEGEPSDQQSRQAGGGGDTGVLEEALRHRGGTLVVAEATEEGVLIRPAVAVPVEVYSPERGARLLLENAVDAEDYDRATEVAREELGVDPDLLGIWPPAPR